MARGGPRQGTPGTTYQNRTDLNTPDPVPVARFQGQEYGQQAQQVAAQQQVPITAAPVPSFVPLDAPTTRPDQPVTHGLPSGAGAGPEALGLQTVDDTMSWLRAAQAANPNPDLLRLISDEEQQRG